MRLEAMAVAENNDTLTVTWRLELMQQGTYFLPLAQQCPWYNGIGGYNVEVRREMNGMYFLPVE
jgi:hypothetical protein